MPETAKVVSEYEQLAVLIPQVWERCIYVTCGRTILLGWQEMSDVAARELHDQLRERIGGTITRQIWIDDFWLGLRHEIKFT